MNLYFRLIFLVIRSSFFKRRISIDETSLISLRVLPNDLDSNLHLNNGRFLTLMDLGRMDLTIRSGLLKMIFSDKLMPVASSVNIVFFKSLSLFEKFTLETKLVAWDEEWFYLRQRFLNKKNRVVASAIVKAAFKKKNKRINTKSIVNRLLKKETNSPDFPKYLSEMLEGDRDHIEMVKLENKL